VSSDCILSYIINYLYLIALITVGTCNKEQVGKHGSFPYYEPSSLTKLNFGRKQHSVLVSFYVIAESLIESSDCIFIK